MRGTKPQPRRSREIYQRRAKGAAVCAGKANVARALTAELQAALDSVDNALLLVDARGQVEWANARFYQWMGIEAQNGRAITEADLAQRLAGQFRHPEQFVASSSMRHGEQAVWDELELLRPEHRIVERLSRPVFDAAGKPIGRLDVYRDITAGRLIHSKLLQTEKMAALGQLVSGIAHELNNPLTSIMGYAQLALAREGGKRTDDSEGSNASRIFEEAQRAQRIVRNLLVFAREARPERAPVQLNEVVERTLALRSYELRVKNIAVHLDLEAGLPRLRGDANQLQQVVLNLLVNAEQAIESGAARRAQGQSFGNIGIRTRSEGEKSVTLEVCDDGPGIPPSVASRIFDPFFTTKPVGEGTGLGLSIAYGIVREHEGEISVGDAPHDFAAQAPGVRWRTSFRVEFPAGTLPVAEAAAMPTVLAAVPRAARPVRGQAPRVLVVEDEQTVAQLISDVLREEGMTADVALAGQDGLERLLATVRPDAAYSYDLVICDLKMPGLDGPALYRELRQRNHPAKDRILFITGDTLSRRTLEFIERYKAPFLAKPFLADELRTAVRQCLGAAAEAPA
jgi:two-component system NtrC family sensor kinase